MKVRRVSPRPARRFPHPALLRRLTVMAITTVVSACASTHAAGGADGPPTRDIGSVAAEQRTVDPARLPQEVGGFRRVHVRRYPDPGAGTHVRYTAADGTTVDVYVYPMGRVILREPAGARARAEAEFFKQALQVQRTQRLFDSFRITGEGPVEITVGGDARSAWLTSARLERRGEQRDTHQHLVEVGTTFIKFRSTFEPGAGREAEVRAFIGALLHDSAPEG